MPNFETCAVFHRIVDLNNQAVHDMHAYEFIAAISKLATSSRAAKLLISRRSLNEDPKLCPQYALLTDWSRGTSLTHLYSNEVDVEVDTSCGAFCLFRRPLRLRAHPDGVRSEHDLVRIINLLAFVNVYNLALCHHLQGMSATSHQKKVCLRKAVRLYQCAGQLLNMHGDTASQEFVNKNMFTAHSVVMLNNILHIDHELKNDELIQRCKPQLSRAIMQILVERQLLQQQSSTASQGQDDFLLYIDDVVRKLAEKLFLLLPDSTAPAA